MFHALANPARFLRLMAVIRPWAGWVALVGLIAGLLMGRR